LKTPQQSELQTAKPVFVIYKHMKIPRSPHASTKQLNYLEILFNDVGMNRTQRNAWLSMEFSRPFSFLAQLTSFEASKVIDMLSEMKENL